MSKPPSPSGRTNLASCVVATVFLILLAMVIVIVYLAVFKPQDPKIAVSAVQVPSYSSVNGTGTVNLTFSQYVSVRNRNRGTFSHYDSSLELLYYGRQVGFMFVPAGKIDAGRTEYLAATFKVQSLPLGLGGPNSTTSGLDGSLGPMIEMESRIDIAGRVRVLHVFSHHVEAKARCRVAIAISDGSVLGFHC